MAAKRKIKKGSNTKKKLRPAKKPVKRVVDRKQKFVCYDCGTEVIMDLCGIGFRHLICCGNIMKKKTKT